ncbi:MAG: hypothetical protein JNM00_15825 [Flavobacteriales bacterium]|nr:hypothetical protein [Flavobacteriales bacterium]
MMPFLHLRNYVIPSLGLCLLTCNETMYSSPKEEFEGVITYSVEVNALSGSLFSMEELAEMYGDTLRIFFKPGKWRMMFNGKDISDSYYFSESNSECTLRRGVDTLFVNDCSVSFDKLIRTDSFSTSQKILNHNCKGFEIENERNTRVYLYSTDYYMNGDLIRNFVSGNLNRYYSFANAPFLFYEYKGKFFETKYKAIDIKPMKLDERIFAFPDLPRSAL